MKWQKPLTVVKFIGWVCLLALLVAAAGLPYAWGYRQARAGLPDGGWGLFFQEMQRGLAVGFAAAIAAGIPVLFFIRRLWRRTQSAGRTAIFLLAVAAVAAVTAAAWPRQTIFGRFLWSTFVVSNILYGANAFRLGAAAAIFIPTFAAAGLLYLLVSRGGFRRGLLPEATRSSTQANRIVRLAAAIAAGAGLVGVIAWYATAAAWLPPKAIAQRPNVVLISIDAVRADHTTIGGYSRNTTPELAALAQEATVFTDFMTAGVWTLPSHTTMLSGVNPFSHGVIDIESHIGTRVLLLNEWLRANGYHADAIISSLFLSPEYGFVRGFDTYDMWMGGRDAAALVGRAIERLNRAHTPFFLFLHIFDPHWPYTVPAKYRIFSRPDDPVAPEYSPLELEHYKKWLAQAGPRARQAATNLYDAEIRYADRELGRLFAQLKRRGLWDNTIIAVTADHGESLGDRGKWGHGDNVYQEALHVPLMLRVPPRLGTTVRRVDELTGMVDLAPTLAELVGLPLPAASRDGRSLVCLLRGDCVAPWSHPYVAYQATKNRSWQLFAIREGFIKFIKSLSNNATQIDPAWSPQLYDLAQDPGETVNLIAEQPERAAEMERRLGVWMRTQTLRTTSDTTILSPAAIEQLRSLGYVL